MSGTWRVTTAPSGPRSGIEMLVHIINCHSVFKALTRAQRRALFAADGGQLDCHPRVLAALESHGLADGGRLTEAGDEIRAWNLPEGHPDRPGNRQKASTAP